MKLTKETAEKNIGKYIDCYRRVFGYYPMQIIRSKGLGNELLLKDPTNTCMPIPSDEKDFNCADYDYIFELVED